MKAKCAVLAILVLLLSGVSFADSSTIYDTLYNVIGSLTITGNNVCGGPCVETLTFSFELGFVEDGIPRDTGFYLPYWVDGTMNVSSVGPLSGFIPFHTGLDESNDNYLGWTDVNCVLNSCGGTALYDEIDIQIEPLFGSRNQPLPITFSQLYNCGTALCIQDFASAPGLGPQRDGTAQATITAITPVPEGPEAWMFSLSAFILFASIGIAKLRVSAIVKPKFRE